MKKLLLLLSAVALITATSCRKNYFCGCYNSNYPTSNISFNIKATSSMEADIKCFAHNDDTLSCSIN